MQGGWGDDTRQHTMGNVTSKVLADDDVPCGTVPSVKLLFDLSRNILLDVVFLEGGGGDVDTLLLHLLAHVDALYDSPRTCVAISHS